MRAFGFNKTNIQNQERPQNKFDFSPCKVSTETIESGSDFSENDENKAPQQNYVAKIHVSPAKQDRQVAINKRLQEYDGVVKDQHRGIRESLSSPRLFENMISLRFSDLYKPIQQKPLKGTSDDNVKVIVRIRPLTTQDTGGKQQPSVNKLNDNTISVGNQAEGQYFYFDYVAGPEADQSSFFKTVGKPIVENCIAGYNSCVIAYGQTGSGKTHTMFGDIREIASQQQDEAGLVPRMFQYLLEQLEQFKKNLKEGRRAEYQIVCSYVEIYQEIVTDLLTPVSNRLSIKEERNGKITVEGATQEGIKSVDDIMAILVRGSGHKRIQETKMNKQSSRSHCILICDVIVKMTEGATSKTKKSTLHLVDLAGSERQKLTNTKGKSLKEANFINKSLAALGLVILKLERGQKHISYRDSKLTYLLQNSLGGNAKTIFIANVSQSNIYQSETNSTLGFAYRAKSIKNKAVINEDTQKIQQAIRNEQLQQENTPYNHQHYRTPQKNQRARAQVSKNPQVNQQMDQKNMYTHELQIQYVNIIREKQELQNQLISKEIDIDILRQKESNTQTQLLQARKEIESTMQQNEQLKQISSVQRTAPIQPLQSQAVQNAISQVIEQVLKIVREENQNMELANYQMKQDFSSLRVCDQPPSLKRHVPQSQNSYPQDGQLGKLQKFNSINSLAQWNLQGTHQLCTYQENHQPYPVKETENQEIQKVQNNKNLNGAESMEGQTKVSLTKFTQLSKALASFNDFNNQQKFYRKNFSSDDILNYLMQNSSNLQQELYALCKNRQQIQQEFTKVLEYAKQADSKKLQFDKPVSGGTSTGQDRHQPVPWGGEPYSHRTLEVKTNFMNLKSDFFALKNSTKATMMGFQDFMQDQMDFLKPMMQPKKSLDTRFLYSNYNELSDPNTLLIEKPSETQLYSNLQQNKEHINHELEEYCHELEREKAEIEITLKNKSVRMETLEESLRAVTQERFQTNKQLFQFMNDLDERLNKHLKQQPTRDATKVYDDDSGGQQISAIYNSHHNHESISIAENLRKLNTKHNFQNLLTSSMSLDPVDSLRKLCDKIQDRVLLIPNPTFRTHLSLNSDQGNSDSTSVVDNMTPQTPRTACEFSKINDPSEIARSIWQRQRNQINEEDDQMTTYTLGETTRETNEPVSNQRSSTKSIYQDTNPIQISPKSHSGRNNIQDQRHLTSGVHTVLEQPTSKWRESEGSAGQDSQLNQNTMQLPASFNGNESWKMENTHIDKEATKTTICSLSDANLLEDAVSETTLDELLQTSQNSQDGEMEDQMVPEIQEVFTNQECEEHRSSYGSQRRLTDNLILEKQEPINSYGISMRDNLGDAALCESPRSHNPSNFTKNQSKETQDKSEQTQVLQQSIIEIRNQINVLSQSLNSKIDNIRGSVILDNSEVSFADVQKLNRLENQNDERIQKITEQLQESIEEDKFCCLRILYVPTKYDEDVQKARACKALKTQNQNAQNKGKGKQLIQPANNSVRKVKKKDQKQKLKSNFVVSPKNAPPTYEQKENMKYLETIV